MAQLAAFQKHQALKASLASNVQSSSVGTTTLDKPSVGCAPNPNDKHFHKPTKCWHCETPITKGISKSEKNPERVYIKCPLSQSYPECNQFFVWDDSTQEELKLAATIWKSKVNTAKYLREAESILGPAPGVSRKRKDNADATNTGIPTTLGTDDLLVMFKSIMDKQEVILQQLVAVAAVIKITPDNHSTVHAEKKQKKINATVSSSSASSSQQNFQDINEFTNEPDYDIAFASQQS